MGKKPFENWGRSGEPAYVTCECGTVTWWNFELWTEKICRTCKKPYKVTPAIIH